MAEESLRTDPVSIIFGEDDAFLHDHEGAERLISVFVGDPGCGKTLLAMVHAKRLLRRNIGVALIALEQSTDSLIRQLERFHEGLSGRGEPDATPLKYEVVPAELPPLKGQAQKDELCLQIVETPADLLEGGYSDFVNHLATVEDHFLEHEYPLGLLILDNSNSVPRRESQELARNASVQQRSARPDDEAGGHLACELQPPETSERDDHTVTQVNSGQGTLVHGPWTPVPHESHPIGRDRLPRLLARVCSSLLFIVEARHKTHSEYLEFHADGVVHLEAHDTGTAFVVRKTRHRERSMGTHWIRFRSRWIEFEPSVECVLEHLKREPQSERCRWDLLDPPSVEDGGPQEPVARLAGWRQHFGEETIPQGTILAIAGPPQVGKTNLLKVVLSALTGGRAAAITFGRREGAQGDGIGFADSTWSANRLFYELALQLIGNRQYGIVALDGVARLRAAFPAVRDSPSFVAALFSAARILGMSAVLETDDLSPLGRQVLALADVQFDIRFVSIDHGGLRVLTVGSAASLGGQPDTHYELTFEVLEDNRVAALKNDIRTAAIDPKPFHPWRLLPDGSTRKVHVNLILPALSPGQKHEFERLSFLVRQTVGDDYVNAIGMTGPREARGAETRLVPRYAAARSIMTTAGHRREGLTVATCDDFQLGVRTRQGATLPGNRLVDALEELGEPSDWHDVLGATDDLLFGPVLNESGHVVAVPFTVDAGFVLFGSGVSPHARDVPSWSSLFMKTDGRTDVPFSFSGGYQETRNFMLLEMLFDALEEEGGSILDDSSKLSRAVLEPRLSAVLANLRRWCRTDDIGGGRGERLSDRGCLPTEAKERVNWCRREWFGLLTCHFDDFTDLLAKGVQLRRCPTSRVLCSVQYLVVPRGSACREFGTDIIRSFISRDRARDRLLQLIGLSPYREHYEAAAWRGDAWTISLEDFRSRSFERKYLLRSMIFPEYLAHCEALSELVEAAVLALPSSKSQSTSGAHAVAAHASIVETILASAGHS